jgi:hypothetical protein
VRFAGLGAFVLRKASQGDGKDGDYDSMIARTSVMEKLEATDLLSRLPSPPPGDTGSSSFRGALGMPCSTAPRVCSPLLGPAIFSSSTPVLSSFRSRFRSALEGKSNSPGSGRQGWGQGI